MKQISLFDSFLKKQKPMQAPPPPNTLSTNEKQNKEEFGTADKIESRPKEDPPSVKIQDFKAEPIEDELNKPKSNFKELINGNDFAFDADQDVRKKRKM